MELASTTMDRAHEALRRVFGFEDFRGVQAEVVRRVLAGRSTLAVMPTGAGKSLTYQLPATILEGTCVVISPLIALMHDQLRAARANGIRAATLTSVGLMTTKSTRSSSPVRTASIGGLVRDCAEFVLSGTSAYNYAFEAGFLEVAHVQHCSV